MAQVWRAQDQRLERTVAIKFLAAGSADNPEFLARLFHEAQAIAAISHPNVIGVLDYGTTATGPYLVMEYIPGGNLTDLSRTQLPPERAVEIMQQVAAGAGAAHAKGIVHRDIKPGNILLCDDGSVKLADFGIASSEVATNLTATGAAIGSPHYISPEQAMGKQATPAADVYAMGVVLYELLCGRLPFEGGNATAIAISHVEEDAQPPSSLVPELDPQLDALVMRCLAKQPQARFEDGNALAAALADPSFAGAPIGSPDQEITAPLARYSWGRASWARAVAGAGQMGATRASVLKKAAAALVVVALLVAIGIHVTSQPGVAEPRTPKQPSSSQRQSHPKKGVSSVTTSSVAVTVSSAPTTSQPQGTHKSPKPKPSSPSPSVTAGATTTSPPTTAPTTAPTTTTTSAPSPTPTPTASAATP
jgi:serine/threonine-protein kinase